MVIRRYTIHAPQLEGRPWEEARQELQRFLRYLMDANDTVQEGAGIAGVVDGGVDHGEIAGLGDDDHTQYLKEKASGGTAGEIPLHDHSSGSQAGQVDHGSILGLTDDDHTLYLKERLSGGAEAEVPGHSHQAVGSAGQLDHGLALTGLTDDDHTQYLETTRHAAIDAADHGSGAATSGHVLTADGAGGASWAAAAGGGGGAVAYRFAISDPPAGDSLYKFQVAPVAGQIVKVSVVMAGTGSVDVNVELEAAEILGSDLTVTTSWTDSGALTEAVAAGDEIDVSVKNVVSPVGYLVVQIDFEAS